MGNFPDEDENFFKKAKPDENENEDEKDPFEFGFSFDAGEGQIDDETQYTGDLNEEQRKLGNLYDPAMSAGELNERDPDEQDAKDLHINVADAEDVGLAYDDEDSYLNDDDDYEFVPKEPKE